MVTKGPAKKLTVVYKAVAGYGPHKRYHKKKTLKESSCFPK
jgi:PII-like signaling protein